MNFKSAIVAALALAAFGCNVEPEESSPEDASDDTAAPFEEEATASTEEAIDDITSCANQCDDKTMIIGCDDRTRYNGTTLGVAPWKHVGRLSNGCTGTLIGDRAVLTAAHCLYDDNGFFAGPIGFSLGQTSSCKKPYGTQYVQTAVIPHEYTVTSGGLAGKAWDYAVVILNAAPPNAEPMDYGYETWSNLSTMSSLSIGYPGSKAEGSLWSTGSKDFLGRWLDPVDSNRSGVLYVNNDGEGGQSGSPVYTYYLGARKLVGVLIGSPEADCQAGRLWAARIVPETEDRIDLWKTSPTAPTFPSKFKVFGGGQIKPAEAPPLNCIDNEG
ncbi:MAG: trypsin-like serine protease [Polyangiaceae bacterium]|nr:trypsin-like serine protease [Polyangiaceae bacterium]